MKQKEKKIILKAFICMVHHPVVVVVTWGAIVVLVQVG
jgi:hypothetical protein